MARLKFVYEVYRPTPTRAKRRKIFSPRYRSRAFDSRRSRRAFRGEGVRLGTPREAKVRWGVAHVCRRACRSSRLTSMRDARARRALPRAGGASRAGVGGDGGVPRGRLPRRGGSRRGHRSSPSRRASRVDVERAAPPRRVSWPGGRRREPCSPREAHRPRPRRSKPRDPRRLRVPPGRWLAPASRARSSAISPTSSAHAHRPDAFADSVPAGDANTTSCTPTRRCARAGVEGAWFTKGVSVVVLVPVEPEPPTVPDPSPTRPRSSSSTRTRNPTFGDRAPPSARDSSRSCSTRFDAPPWPRRA